MAIVSTLHPVTFQAACRDGVYSFDLDSGDVLSGAASAVARGLVPDNVLNAMLSRKRFEDSRV